MYLSEFSNIFENENSHFYYQGTSEIVLQLAENYAFKKGYSQQLILDAGCGTGFLTKKYEKWGRVIGIDISPSSLKIAQKRDIKVLKASVDNLPFKDNTFDVIFTIDVLYHQKVNDNKALKEFNRILKPGGYLIIKVPAYNWLKRNHDIVVQTQRRYSMRPFFRQLQNSGFVTIKITYWASFLLIPILIKMVVEKIIKSQNINSDVMNLPNWLNYLMLLSLRMENLILRFINLPFGLSILGVARKNKLRNNVEPLSMTETDIKRFN